MREIEVVKQLVDWIAPLGGIESCNYRNPKDTHMHGQFCLWGYKDSLGEEQCKHFNGTETKKRLIKDMDLEEEYLIVKCSLDMEKLNGK